MVADAGVDVRVTVGAFALLRLSADGAMVLTGSCALTCLGELFVDADGEIYASIW